VALCLAALAPACESGAQIVDYSPTRGSSDVATNTPIQITFDHPVDRGSVARRFHVLPTVRGQVTWPRANQLVFVHESLKTDTDYTVELQAGYQDVHGHTYSLRHWWGFHTETAPEVVSIAPAGEKSFDPAGYLTLNFSREMDLGSLSSALTLSPSTPIALRLDAGDARRVIVAPRVLLEAGQSYSLRVGREALDVDGNPLRAPAESVFVTGAERPLRHFVGVLTQRDGESGGEGVWIVDENRLPRRVSNEAASGFSWTPDGQSLLLRLHGDSWEAQQPGDSPVELPFQAGWAAALGSGAYVYLDHGKLSWSDAAGNSVELAAGVDEAALAPDGERLAYTVPNGQGTVVMGMEVDLRSRYRLAGEPGAVSGLAWSPDGQRLAYRVLGADPAHTQVRVRSLAGSGQTLTVAEGDAGVPRWLDGSHLVFAATVAGPAGTVSRAFRVSAVSAGGPLTAGAGLPSAKAVDVHDPSPSPDGHQIAFLSGQAGDQQVWLMNADGTGLVQLTEYDALDFPYSCLALAWTPS
jgi:hypothetical protein